MIKRTSKYLSLFLLTALIIALLYLTSSFSGLKLVTSVLSDVLPGHIQLNLRSGALTRTIVINSLGFDNKQVHVTANNVHLKLQILPLILNELDIKQFSADKLTVHIKAQKKVHANSTPPEFAMPIKIALANTFIKQFQYQADGKNTVVSNLQLDGEVRSNLISIAALKASYQGSHYNAHGQLNFKPVSLDITLQQQQHQQTKMQASFKAHGHWQHLKLHASLTAPFELNADATVSNLLTKPSWTITGTSQHLAFSKDMAAYDASFKASGDSRILELNGEAHTKDSNTHTEIKFALHSDNLPKAQFTASASWQNMFWPQRKQHVLASPSGSLSITGNINRYTLKGDLNVLGHNIPKTELSLSGQGNKNGITIPNLAINTLNGTIKGNGTLNWQQQLQYQLQMQATHLQPNVEWVNFPGNISFGMQVKSQQQATRLIVSSIKGTLRDENIHGFANLVLSKNQLKKATLNLQSDAAHIQANLSANQHQQLKLHWNINIPHIERLTPFAQGSIISKATYQDNKTHFTVAGNLSARNFIWQSYSIDSLNSDFDFDSDANKSSIIDLDANEITLNQYYIHSVSLSTKGKNPRHRLDMVINNHDNILNASLLANYNSALSRWSVNVKKLDLISKLSGNWHLAKPFNLVYNPTLLSLDHFNWRARQQQININNLNITNNVLNSAEVTLHKILLKSFNPWLPGPIQIHGSLDLKAQYKLDKKNANAKLTLNLNRARFSYPLHERIQNISINKAAITGTIDNNQLKSKLDIRLNNTDFIKLDMNVDNFDPYNIFNLKQDYHASLHSNLQSLNIIKPFASNLDQLAGQFKANMTWNGTLESPQIKGTAALSNASLQIVQQGLNISHINFKTTGLGNTINYLLSAHSGKGQIKASGNTTLNDHYKTLIDLTGNQFEIDRSPHFHVIVSPKLKLAITNDALHVTGDLLVPYTNIDLLSYANVQTLSSDVQIIQATGKQSQDSLLDKFYANINLILGDNISLKTKFLTAKLAGKLQLTDTPKTQTNATGELTITNGTVSAFGQSLTITNGKLLYAGGPTTNPGLNIKAFKQIKTFVNPAANSVATTSLSTGNSSDSGQTISAPLQQKTINVGVSVSNSLSNPHIMLYSDQADLSQADILSYLILGYPMNSATNQQGEALIQAANALSASNNDMSGLISNIKDTLNLNEIGLQSNNYLNTSNNSVEQNTSLVLGKMLSPKLFVHYSIGLIVPINTLSATYSFNHNWSLQTETNSLGNGVDLIYSWQHN